MLGDDAGEPVQNTGSGAGVDQQSDGFAVHRVSAATTDSSLRRLPGSPITMR